MGTNNELKGWPGLSMLTADYVCNFVFIQHPLKCHTKYILTFKFPLLSLLSVKAVRKVKVAGKFL